MLCQDCKFKYNNDTFSYGDFICVNERSPNFSEFVDLQPYINFFDEERDGCSFGEIKEVL